MNVEQLRQRGEGMCGELGRETYRTGAGLEAESHYAEIFGRYPDLADRAAVDAARGHRELFEWVVDNRVGRAAATLDDRLQAWEARAVIALAGGESLPYQRAAIELANEPQRPRRLAIDAARRAVLEEPAGIRRQRLALERELLAALGMGDQIATRSALSGVDLALLGERCAAFLAATADLYRDVLREVLRSELGLAPGDADRADVAYLFRGAGYDEFFRGSELVATAQRPAGGDGARRRGRRAHPLRRRRPRAQARAGVLLAGPGPGRGVPRDPAVRRADGLPLLLARAGTRAALRQHLPRAPLRAPLARRQLGHRGLRDAVRAHGARGVVARALHGAHRASGSAPSGGRRRSPCWRSCGATRRSCATSWSCTAPRAWRRARRPTRRC